MLEIDYDPWASSPDEIILTEKYQNFIGTISPYYTFDPISGRAVRTRGSDS